MYDWIKERQKPLLVGFAVTFMAITAIVTAAFPNGVLNRGDDEPGSITVPTPNAAMCASLEPGFAEALGCPPD